MSPLWLICLLWLSTLDSRLSTVYAAAGSWNGVAFTAWNGVAQTAWNGSAISCGASVFSATNIVGVTNRSRWIADGQTASADGILTNWIDSGVSPITLTNLGATTTMPRWTNAVLNGHAFARFDSGDNNSSVLYTSSQPHTVVMVVRWWSATISGARYYYDSTDATKKNALRNNSGLEISSWVDVGTITTNKWQVLEIVHNGTSSGFFSNNVSAGAISATSEVCQGFVLGNSVVGGSGTFIDVAEVLTYFGTFGAVESAGTFSVDTERYGLYNSLTNKYGITP